MQAIAIAATNGSVQVNSIAATLLRSIVFQIVLYMVFRAKKNDEKSTSMKSLKAGMLNPMRDKRKACTGEGKGRHLRPRPVQSVAEGKKPLRGLSWGVRVIIGHMFMYSWYSVIARFSLPSILLSCSRVAQHLRSKTEILSLLQRIWNYFHGGAVRRESETKKKIKIIKYALFGCNVRNHFTPGGGAYLIAKAKRKKKLKIKVECSRSR